MGNVLSAQHTPASQASADFWSAFLLAVSFCCTGCIYAGAQQLPRARSSTWSISRLLLSTTCHQPYWSAANWGERGALGHQTTARPVATTAVQQHLVSQHDDRQISNMLQMKLNESEHISALERPKQQQWAGEDAAGPSFKLSLSKLA